MTLAHREVLTILGLDGNNDRTNDLHDDTAGKKSLGHVDGEDHGLQGGPDSDPAPQEGPDNDGDSTDGPHND